MPLADEFKQDTSQICLTRLLETSENRRVTYFISLNVGMELVELLLHDAIERLFAAQLSLEIKHDWLACMMSLLDTFLRFKTK